MGSGSAGVDKWLTPGETVVYDSKSNNIKVNNEPHFHAIATNKRAIFLQADKIHEVAHNSVVSISWQRKVHWALLGFGMILIAIGLVVNLYLDSNALSPITGFDRVFSYIILGGGVVSIIVFVFRRPEKLQIYSGGRPMMIDGPYQKLKEIMLEIRNQQALYEEQRQRHVATGEEIPKSVEEAIKQLKLRLAKGEITEEEYMRLKKTIES